jgi:predicted phosphoribosyltransferase
MDPRRFGDRSEAGQGLRRAVATELRELERREAVYRRAQATQDSRRSISVTGRAC